MVDTVKFYILGPTQDVKIVAVNKIHRVHIEPSTDKLCCTHQWIYGLHISHDRHMIH